MNESLAKLDIETLKDMHSNVSAKVKSALLNRQPWDTIQEYRHHLTQIEIAIFNKIRAKDLNPAENLGRN